LSTHFSKRSMRYVSPAPMVAFKPDVTNQRLHRRSELDHHLDGFTVIHCTVAIGNAVDAGDANEHEAWLDSTFQHVGHKLVQVGAQRRGASGDGDVDVGEG